MKLQNIFIVAAWAEDSGDTAEETCLTNELRCRAAIVTFPDVCFTFKSTVVNDDNSKSEFERHSNDFAAIIKATLEKDSDMRDHYYSSKFEVTSIVPENVEQVENFFIDEMNGGFQFFYQVETIEAPMVICGDAEIRLQEIFEEEIYEDQYWTDMAKTHGIAPLVNMTSMPEDADIYTTFFYINNPVECEIMNGGCSHQCIASQCQCPPCWELDLEGTTCSPSKGKVITTCNPDEIVVTIDSCVIEDYAMTDAVFLEGDCMPTYDDSTEMWTIKTGLDSCGTTNAFPEGENFVTYTNTLSIPPESYYSGPLAGLTFSRPIEWDFSCDYALDFVVKSDYTLESKMHKWAFNEGVGSFQFDLTFFENEYFDAELDNLAVAVGKPVYFNVEMNEGKYLNNVEFRVTDCTVKERQTPANTFTIFDYTKEDQCFNQDSLLSPVEFREVQEWFQGNNQQQFSFRGFTFPDSSASKQMLMCNIKICDKTNNNSECKSYCYDV